MPDANAIGATSSPTRAALTRAAGWNAIAAGDFDDAYLHLREQFHPDGTPTHFVVSDRAVAEMAWAAARSGRTDEAQPLITKIGHRLGPEPPVRLQLLHHQALALVAPAPTAETHFRLAVFNPAGDQWPLERARARLHYGEWLRRARRPADARPLLTAALATFDRLGATPLSALARAELRAAGVTPKNERTAGAFARVDRPGTPDRSASRLRIDQPPDRRATKPLTAHNRVPPLPRLSQARSQPPPRAA